MAKNDRRQIETSVEPQNTKKFICKPQRPRLKVVKREKVCKIC